MWTRTSHSLTQGLGSLVARLQREEGQTMAEYALLLTLIVVAVTAVIALLGGQIASVFNSVTGQL